MKNIMNLFHRSNKKGFTLVELLVVIGILAVLLAITLIAINPARQFSQANNTKRSSDVNAILNAIHQYSADHKGSLPGGIPSGVAPTDAKVLGNGVGEVDICSLLVTTYLAGLPTDPSSGTQTGGAAGDPVTNCGIAAYHTGYTVVSSASDNRVTVAALTPELGAVISVTR